MKVELEQYEPLGNQILLKLEVKGTTDSGIILDKKKADKWMEVVKTGEMVTALEVGDFAVMGEPRGMAHMSFGDEMYMQVSEHDIIGKIRAADVGKDKSQLNLSIT